MNRPEPLLVSQLNNYIKNLIDDDEMLNNVYIRGELSNFKKHYSGHLYFTLKDETSLVKCVMFKSYTNYLGNVRVREIICDNIGSQCDVIARVLQQPTCTNARITENGIEIEVVFEVLVEVIGETKMMVTVFNNCNECDNNIDDFENEINEDFLNDK